MNKLGEKIPQNYPDGPVGVCGICGEAVYSKLLLGVPMWLHEVSASHDAEPGAPRTLLSNLTADERARFFPAFVPVNVEVLYRGRWTPATFEALCGPAHLVVMFADSGLVTTPDNVRISHEVHHTLERTTSCES